MAIPPMRRMRCLSLCFCCALALAPGVRLHAGALKLVTGNDYPPYSDQSLPGGGLATQRVMAAFQAIGETPQLDWLPWARGLQLTRLGHYAATFPHVRTAEREAAFLYSAPLFRLNHYLYARPDDKRLDAGTLGLAQGRLCLPFGWAASPEIERLIAEQRIAPERPASLAACARMLILQRADFFIADPALAAAALAEAHLAPDALRQGRDSVGELSLHLIVPRSRADAAELVKRFDQGLAKLAPSAPPPKRR